jgi:hypothetical protein
MDTITKIFGYKWENAKMHGLQNVKVFMDTKMQRFSWIQKCKDSWIWAWKQIYAKMHRNKCKERFMDIKTHKISGYKCKDTWMQNANIFMDTNARIQGYQNAKMLGYKYKKTSRYKCCKDAHGKKCKDFWMQMQNNSGYKC